MTLPVVSVIVATYNRAASLPAALESAAAQSIADLEIVVVDDGSTDDTREVVSSLRDERIHYLYRPNQGLPGAWNLGVENSRGEFIAFLDSDDYWLPGKLAQQLAMMQDRGEEIGGCITGYYVQDFRGKRRRVVPSPTHATVRQILRENMLHLGTTFLCRASVFDKVGPFDEQLRRGQDTDWMIRFRGTYELGIVAEPLAVFTQHLARSGEILERSRLYFLEKHRAAILREGRLFHRRKTADVYRDLAYQFSREGNPGMAHTYARRALAMFPLMAPGLWLLLVDSLLGTRLKPALDARRYPRIGR